MSIKEKAKQFIDKSFAGCREGGGEVLALTFEELQEVIEETLDYVLPEKTLRDEFAMTVLIECCQTVEASTNELAAKMAYEIADAMMEARK